MSFFTRNFLKSSNSSISSNDSDSAARSRKNQLSSSDTGAGVFQTGGGVGNSSAKTSKGSNASSSSSSKSPVRSTSKQQLHDDIPEENLEIAKSASMGPAMPMHHSKKSPFRKSKEKFPDLGDIDAKDAVGSSVPSHNNRKSPFRRSKENLLTDVSSTAPAGPESVFSPKAPPSMYDRLSPLRNSKENLLESDEGKAVRPEIKLGNIFRQKRGSKEDLLGNVSASPGTSSKAPTEKAVTTSSTTARDKSPVPVSKTTASGAASLVPGTTNASLARMKNKVEVLPRMELISLTLRDIEDKRSPVVVEVPKNADLQTLVTHARKLNLLPQETPLTFIHGEVPIPKQCWPAVEVRHMGSNITLFYRDLPDMIADEM
eukprot:TRINITY_DN4617_c0_g1_i1.p1 TRINITY_DN4617_c0_g1~~TRINITY_DN4617_c0_g1_i1.p1  ORF type:complete len:373 (-),score=106.71 TRINITY_DN4617_c0_g1_i1:29-1147(-)